MRRIIMNGMLLLDWDTKQLSLKEITKSLIIIVNIYRYARPAYCGSRSVMVIYVIARNLKGFFIVYLLYLF